MPFDNDNGSSGSNGYNSLTAQANPNYSSGAEPSSRHCTGNDVIGDHGNESPTGGGRGMVGGPRSQYQIDPRAEETHGGCMRQVPEKNAATSGLSPTNFTPQYHDIDCRLLEGYRESGEFHSRTVALRKTPSGDGLEYTGVTIPVDATKRRRIEAAFTARGLTLLSEYPVTDQLLFYAKRQVVLANFHISGDNMLTCIMFLLK